MMNEFIYIKNARTHNLKNISLKIPKNKIVVFTGVSGSGKSSLVFDTIYIEAQRQLIDTFSSFARARLPKLSKPPLDEIKNISTAIVIDQKKVNSSPRSTIGTLTGINDYLKLLFSKWGNRYLGPPFLFGFNHPKGMCPDCKGIGEKIKIDITKLIDLKKSLKEGAINHPDYNVGGWNWEELINMKLFNVDKKLRDFSEKELNNFLYANEILIEKKSGEKIYSKKFEGIVKKLEKLYLNKSLNGLNNLKKGTYQKYFIRTECDSCQGTRLNETVRSIKINGKNIAEISNMELTTLSEFLGSIEGEIKTPIIQKIQKILSNLVKIGVGYLSLNRSIKSLSGGESQRVKIAKQLNCDLVNIMYILDEPSIGLHPKDIGKLIKILEELKEKDNSVFVIEHDFKIIKNADYIIDLGPKAGNLGGEIIYTGNFKDMKNSGGLTAKYLNEKKKIAHKRKKWKTSFEIKNANLHNLKNFSTKIPKGVLTCVTGVAGSGKSSLINEIFTKENKNVILIDQSPISKSSRSNSATYLRIFDLIREEFAKANNVNPSLFSFNSKGACPKCNGSGIINYDLSFLEEIKTTCDLCNGKRYTLEALKFKYNNKNIFEVLNMTINEIKDFFKNPEIKRRLQILCEVGLEYLELGQPLSTLSGGECQRIKLASELHKKGNIYVMDEPTTGLHMADIDKLLKIIKKLTDNGNTVVVIEHNLDVVKYADWIIDLGPDGGSKGGELLFEGTPEELIENKQSYTGKYLKKYLMR